MSGRPRVVAVVLNWCREELTAACLRSLAEQETDGVELEVLLVDNGSEDGSGPRLRERFPEVAYLQTGDNLGYTGGNNAGIRWALERGADHVLILNNDTTVEPGAVTRLVATAREGDEVGGVSPTIVYADAPDRIWYAGGRFSPLRGLGVHWRQGQRAGADGAGTPEPVTFLSGCACLLPADVLRDVGLFAPDFFAYVEDAELSLRLHRAGYRLLHEPRARVRHAKPLNGARPEPFAIRLRDRNRRRLMRRHFGPLGRLPFWLWYGPSRLVRAAQYLVRGDVERARAIVKGAL